jgi:SAM-dependent methyltransferase
MSAGMVALARQLVPDGDFVSGDAAELPYPDRSADAVICDFGLHHLPRPQLAVAECGRVLRPGGRFVSTAWDEEINDLAIVPDAIYGAGAKVPDQIPAPPPQPSYLDHEEITALLAGSGMQLLSGRRWDTGGARTRPPWRRAPIRRWSRTTVCLRLARRCSARSMTRHSSSAS